MLICRSSSLVTIADSEFVPLYHHPALLLEKYLPKCAPLMFPGARGHPENPVLCVDCCLSLGNQVIRYHFQRYAALLPEKLGAIFAVK